MPARHADARAIGTFTGRFTVHAGETSLVLAGSGMRLLFNAVERHDLPAALEGVRVARAAGASADALPAGEFQVQSGGRKFLVRARSLQIHERAALYGSVIALPTFPLRQRFLWTVLLTVARFQWGQALIRRLTGRGA